MLGFDINSDFQGQFLGFTFASLENVIVKSVDQNGDVLGNVTIDFNGDVVNTSDEGIAEFSVVAGAYTMIATAEGWNDYTISDSYVEGILVLTAIMIPQPGVSLNSFEGQILWSPVLNSIRFANENDDSFMENELFEPEMQALEYMNAAGYCQKVITGEIRQVQFHSNILGPIARIYNYEDDTQYGSDLTPLLLANSTKVGLDGTEYAFGIYQVNVLFPIEGNFYVKITNLAEDIEIRSEPLQVALHDNVLQLEFTNEQNTDINVWSNGFVIRLTVEAQLYKMQPASERTIFRGSDDRALVLSQRNKRGLLMETFQLPPYMHEALSYGFSLSRCKINGTNFYSEAGYQEPTYIDRYSLSNSSVELFTSDGFGQQVDTLTGDSTFIVDQNDNFVIDTNNNFIIQGDG